MKHFSKYGLVDDSDDDDDDSGGSDIKKLKLQAQAQDKLLTQQKQQQQQVVPGQPRLAKVALDGGMAATNKQHSGRFGLHLADSAMLEDDDDAVYDDDVVRGGVAHEAMDDDLAGVSVAKNDDPTQSDDAVGEIDDDVMDGEAQVPASHKLARHLGVRAEDLQIKKASFFGAGDDDYDFDDEGTVT